MDKVLVSSDEYCRIRYGPNWDATKESKKSKRDTVSRMCRDGVLVARKFGKAWIIEL